MWWQHCEKVARAVVGLGADGANSAGLFAELALDLRDSDGVPETVDMVVQFALNALDCSHAGIVFSARNGHADIAAVTNPALADVYLGQVEAGEGPLITTLTGQQTVLVRDTGTDARWPSWAASVRQLGVASVLDVPMNVSYHAVGVLCLYNSRVDGFDTDDEAVAQVVARHAAVALATARHEEALAKAVDARKLVGQAMGILMERYNLNEDQAFAVLRRHSQDTNTKLHLIAQQLVDTRTLPDHHHPTSHATQAIL